MLTHGKLANTGSPHPTSIVHTPLHGPLCRSREAEAAKLESASRFMDGSIRERGEEAMQAAELTRKLESDLRRLKQENAELQDAIRCASTHGDALLPCSPYDAAVPHELLPWARASAVKCVLRLKPSYAARPHQPAPVMW